MLDGRREQDDSEDEKQDDHRWEFAVNVTDFIEYVLCRSRDLALRVGPT
jgi:hypothetical protein